MATLELSRLNRYKDTKAFSAGDNVEFGLWEAPPEFLVENQPVGSRLHTVRSNEVGFLDLIAVRYFGAGFEEMWWAIAQANSMMNPEQEMYAGQKLIIPSDGKKAGFIGRGGKASVSA